MQADQQTVVSITGSEPMPDSVKQNRASQTLPNGPDLSLTARPIAASAHVCGYPLCPNLCSVVADLVLTQLSALDLGKLACDK